MNISFPRLYAACCALFTCLLLAGCGSDNTGQTGTTQTGQTELIRPTTTTTTTTNPITQARRPRSPDTFVLIPPSVTIAAGGSPSALNNSGNRLEASFLSQFGSLTGIAERVGATLGGVESFWVASNASRTEQLLCITLTDPVSLATIQKHIEIGENIGSGAARIYSISGEGEEQYGLSIIHTRGLLLGKLSSMEQALDNPEPGAVRIGIAALNFLDADFWVAGDQSAAGNQLQSGLPGLGELDESRRLSQAKGFGMGLQLERPTASTTGATPQGVTVVLGLAMEQAPQAKALRPVVERALASTAAELNKPPVRPVPQEQPVPSVDPTSGEFAPTSSDPATPPAPAATMQELNGESGVSSMGNGFRSPGLRPVVLSEDGIIKTPSNESPAVWVQQNEEQLRIAYRFDAWDGDVSIMSDLLRAAGSTASGDVLFPAPLANLYTGYQQWTTEKPGPHPGISHIGEAGHIVGGYSWMTQLLPYIGHETLYFRFDFEKSWTEPENLPWAKQVIPQFLNPADPRVEWKGYPLNGMGLSHFAGMSGVEDRRNVVAAKLPRSDPRAGMFGYDAIASQNEITDGISSTIMLIGTGRLAAPWVQGGGSTIRGAREPYFDSLSGFGSEGTPDGGAIVMFADGSSRVLSSNIDPSVFRAMCTIHGAEDVDLSAIVKSSPPQSAGTLQVILTDPGMEKLNMVKVVRDATGLGLRDSLDIVEKSPQTVKANLTQGEAESLKAAIEAAGGTARIE